MKSRDPKTGRFRRSRSGTPQIVTPTSNLSLEEMLAANVDRRKLTRLILRRAYSCDPKALDFVFQILERHTPPPPESDYDTALLSEEQLRLLLCLLEKARGKAVAERHLASLCRKVIFAAIPDDPPAPEEASEKEPPVIPAPERTLLPISQAASKPEPSPVAMPSTGRRVRSLASSFASQTVPDD